MSSVLTPNNLENLKRLYEEFLQKKKGYEQDFARKYSEPNPYNDNKMEFHDLTAEFIFMYPKEAKEYIDGAKKGGRRSRRRKSRRRKSRRY